MTSSLPSVEQAAALAVPVAAGAEPPADLGTDAAQLAHRRLHRERRARPRRARRRRARPGRPGRSGDASTVDATLVRDLAADFARAVPQHQTLAVELPDGPTAISPADFAQVVVEGVLLARWRYFVGEGRRRADPRPR